MNEKLQVLLVEDHLDRRAEFRAAINAHRKFGLFGETGSEKEGLALLKKGITDVLILDLELEEGDGIHLAEKMCVLPIQRPFVVVTTNNSSVSIHQYLRTELKVDFIYQKTNTSYTPTQVLDIAEKAYRYHRRVNYRTPEENEILKKKILQELQNIGFQKQYIGTEYLLEALFLLSKSKNHTLQISKSIYPILSRQYQCDPSNIERSIRSAIERVWSTVSIDRISRHYPFEVTNKNGRPSNGEFLLNMRQKLFGR